MAVRVSHHPRPQSVRVPDKGRTFRAGVGSLLYVTKGTLHAHENVGEGAGRLLITQTPGGLYECFFEEVGKPMNGEAGLPGFEERPDVERLVEIAAEYGFEIPVPIG